MNYDAIINAAQEYSDRINALRRAYPNGYCLTLETRLHADKAQKSIYLDKAEAVLWAVCDATGIPVDAAISAARIYNRYYERGGEHILDTERLIRSQMPSQTHAQH